MINIIDTIIDDLSEGKFAFYGTEKEKHCIAIPITQNLIINQPYNGTTHGTAIWLVREYYYQQFIINKKEADKQFLALKMLIRDCDTLIWRSCREVEIENAYKVRFAAIKNGEQIIIRMENING